MNTDQLETALAVLPPTSTELGFMPKGVEIQPMGAIFAEDAPAETVEYVMRRAASLSRGTQFILADAMLHESKHGREDFAKWEGMTGIHEKDLRNIRRVGSKIKIQYRRDQGTFDFMRAIANVPEEEQEHWLDVAAEEHLTKGQLRKSIIAGEVTKESGPIDSGRDCVGPHVGKIGALMETMAKSGTLDKARPDKLYNLHRDLLPILKKHADLIRRLSRSGDTEAMRKVKNDLAAIHRA